MVFLEQILTQIHKKLGDAFDVFDGDKTKTVDLKYVPPQNSTKQRWLHFRPIFLKRNLNDHI